MVKEEISRVSEEIKSKQKLVIKVGGQAEST